MRRRSTRRIMGKLRNMVQRAPPEATSAERKKRTRMTLLILGGVCFYALLSGGSSSAMMRSQARDPGFRAADVAFPREGEGGAIAGLEELPGFLRRQHADAATAAHARRIAQLFHVSLDVSTVLFTPEMIKKVRAKGQDPDDFKRQRTVLIQNALMPHCTLAYNAVRSHRFGPSRTGGGAGDDSRTALLLRQCRIPVYKAKALGFFKKGMQIPIFYFFEHIYSQKC